MRNLKNDRYRCTSVHRHGTDIVSVPTVQISASQCGVS